MKASNLAMRHGNPASITDAMQGVQMGFAGVRGGIWNVIINLKDIADETYNQAMKVSCASLLDEARTLLAEATAFGDQCLERMLAKQK
jgi:glutamate formiminotransferase/formiminotetrahydrofolate cyclodeaminase